MQARQAGIEQAGRQAGRHILIGNAGNWQAGRSSRSGRQALQRNCRQIAGRHCRHWQILAGQIRLIAGEDLMQAGGEVRQAFVDR